MKKYLMLVVFAALSVVSFAQIPFYVKGGIGVANWTSSDVDGTDAKFAWRIGVGTEFPISGNFSIQPSLYFVNKGAKGLAEDNDTSLPANFTCQENYLELPVMAAWRVNVANDMNIVFNVGPYIAYGIGGKTKFETKKGGVSSSVVYDTFGDKGFLNRFDAGIGCGVTGEFGRFLVGINAQYGLTNVFSSSDLLKTLGSNHITAYNLSAFLSVGMKF